MSILEKSNPINLVILNMFITCDQMNGNESFTNTHTNCISLLKVLVAPHLLMWPRSHRLWPTWPGQPVAELVPISPHWRHHVDMPSATLWTPTAWWDASPVALTTASTWKPSAAPDTSQSANIMDSHQVRTNTYMLHVYTVAIWG